MGRVSYDELVGELERAPVTWLPGLLAILVNQVVKRKVFVAGGLQSFFAKAVARAEGS